MQGDAALSAADNVLAMSKPTRLYNYLTVPDVHGRLAWQPVVQEWLDASEHNAVIFLGDYCDSPVVPQVQVMKAVYAVLSLKQAYPDRTVLLIGNHDVQYLWSPHGYGAGNGPFDTRPLTELLQTHQELFALAHQVSYTRETFLWSHAGISLPWYTHNAAQLDPLIVAALGGEEAADAMLRDENGYLKPYWAAWVPWPDVLHALRDKGAGLHPGLKALQHCSALRGGPNQHGGLLWAHINEMKKPLPYVHQIVGHSRVNQVTTFSSVDLATSITACDSMPDVPDVALKLADFHVLPFYDRTTKH